MPLMPDWSDALCAALDAEEESLAAACHLRHGMDSEEFEESLGLLLRWDQMRGLEERFQALGGNPNVHTIPSQIIGARNQLAGRMQTIKETIVTTLEPNARRRGESDPRRSPSPATAATSGWILSAPISTAR